MHLFAQAVFAQAENVQVFNPHLHVPFCLSAELLVVLPVSLCHVCYCTAAQILSISTSCSLPACKFELPGSVIETVEQRQSHEKQSKIKNKIKKRPERTRSVSQILVLLIAS